MGRDKEEASMAGGEDSNELRDERCHSRCPIHLFMASESAAATDLRWDGLEKTAGMFMDVFRCYVSANSS